MPPFLIENHDEAYYIWRNAGVAGRALVHVDPHHDMWWLGDPSELTIGNYVCQAVKDGIVSDVIWVVPDETMRTKESRSAVRHHLRRIIAALTAHGLGASVTACTLRSLPALAQPVLLDVDTDFFCIRRVRYRKDDSPGRPWIWPDEMADALRAHGVTADIVTIAYSVEGGYTPLEWKHLGDAFAMEWTNPPDSDRARSGYRAIRESAVTARGGPSRDPVALLRRARRLLPTSAAPVYHQALAEWQRGRIEHARTLCQRAVTLDASYRTPYRTRGFVDLARRRFAAASRAFRFAAAIDPDDAYAHLGLGRVAMARSHWRAAEVALGRSLALNPRLIDAYRAQGDVFGRLGRLDEARRAYARSIKLALEGVVPLTHPTLTSPPDATSRSGRALHDNGHGRTHAALARLDARQGRFKDAIAGYRMALAAGFDRRWVTRALQRSLLKGERIHPFTL